MAKPVFPSSLYPLVYLFLQENGFERTALHFQDESKLGMVLIFFSFFNFHLFIYLFSKI